MKKSRFTETEIIAILKEADSGMLVKDICRKHGISDTTYYNWKSKYGGMSAWQHGHNESFNGVFRDGCLDRWLFYSVQESRRVINAWLDEYNTERPHGALAGVTPASYVKRLKEKTRKAA